MKFSSNWVTQKSISSLDADKEGRKIRQWFKRHLSESTHIYIDPKFGEVGRCPHDYLANLLLRHGFYVNTALIMKGKFIVKQVIQTEDILKNIQAKEHYIVFGYATMCKTCDISETMLQVVTDERYRLRKIKFELS